MKPKKSKSSKDNTDAIIAAGPPADRMCISCSVFPDSTPDQWKYYPGAGWVHQDRDVWFLSMYRFCSVTKQWGLSGSFLRTIYGTTKAYVHPSVAKLEGWSRCDNTQRLAMRDDLVQIHGGGGMVCKSVAGNKMQYDTCKVSGNLYCRGDLQYYKHPHTPGRTCVAREIIISPEYKECPECGAYHERLGFHKTDNGSSYCNDCWVTKFLSKIIHKHDYKGYPDIKRSGSDRYVMHGGKLVRTIDQSVRLYGVECEVEIHDGSPMNRYQLAESVQNAVGADFVVFKNDGSLTGHARDHPLWGFEIVTAPADMAEHKARWAKLEEAEGFKYLRAWDTATCGLHIHVGKAYMTTLQIGRIMTFITSKKNRKFIEKVAGRNSEAASKFLDKGLDGGIRPDPNKYCAVNNLPEHTLEFRIFRGTIRHQHIVRNLEFVDAVVSFCHPAGRSFSELDRHDTFLSFCASNRKAYPFFTKWLGEQELIPAAKLKPSEEAVESVEKETVTNEVASKWY